MSLLSHLLDDVYRTPSIYDQHFAQGLLNDELVRSSTDALMTPLKSGYLRPWRASAPGHSGVSSVKSDKDGFKVNLDVQQFKPNELKVKVIDDFLIVEGKHEEKEDQHGFVSRQFIRRYKLPNTVDHASVISSLSSDGVLTLHAPKKVSFEKGEREIPITHTKSPAIKQADKRPKLEKMEDN